MTVRTVFLGLSMTLALALVACGGGSTGSAGFGTIAVTSITGPLPSGGGPFTVTGGDFSNEVGTQAVIRFEADGGATPFLGGTSGTVDVKGTITTATTITGMSPPAVICGVASVNAFVTVILGSGVWGKSFTAIAIFVPPSLGGISGGGIFQAAVPGSFTINGAGFTPVGGTVIIQWTALSNLFQAGTSLQVKTLGTITGATTITGVSPLALVCGTASEAAAIDKVEFPDGSCTPPGTNLAVSFLAPTITSAENTQAGSANVGTTQFWAAIPESFEITGTGFGPVGGTAIVQWSTPGFTTFQAGTSEAVLLPGTILSDTLIAGVSPEGMVCGVALQGARLRVTMPDGACSVPPAADSVQLEAPTATAISNLDRAFPAFAFAPFYGHIPETFEITGEGYGPVGGTATVTFTETNATNPTPFSGGTSATATVVATITSPTTLQGTTPEAVYVTPPGNNVGSGVHFFETGSPTLDITLQGGSCAAQLAPGFVFESTVVTPAFGFPAPSVPSTLTLGQVVPGTFTLTGNGFYPPGSVAMVVFDDAGGGGSFNGNPTLTVPGIVVDETTITGQWPTLTTPRLTANLSAQVTVVLVSGSTSRCPNAVVFVAPPTIVTVANARAPFQQANPAAAVANTWLAKIPTNTTITGTGFHAAITDLWYDSVLGAAKPIGAGLLGTIPEPTATAPGPGTIRTVTPTTINGASPTDNTLTQATPATLRILNPDNQFDERAGLTFETTGVLPNVNATPLGNSQAEMQISVNPTNLLNAALCAHDSSGGFVRMTHAYTLDGGATWARFFVGPSTTPAPDGFPDGSFRFDPCGIFDRFGNYYCVYGVDPGGIGALTGLRSLVVQRSSDGGATFDTVVVANFPLDNLDRWTVATGPRASNPANEVLAIGLENLTTQDQWISGVVSTALGSALSNLGSAIINDIPVPPGRGFAHCAPAVGPNGEWYVSYIENDGFFPPVPQTLIFMDALSLPGLVPGMDVQMAATDNSGFRLQDGTFTPEVTRGKGVLPMGQVIMTGPNAGRAVWVWTDMDPFGGNGRDTTVVTQYSDDNGANWSAPQPVHGLQLDFQFFPWMGRDPVRGDLYIGYYDTRRDPGRQAIEWLVTASEDGATWTSSLLAAQAPSNAGNAGGNDMLEYNGIAVVDGCVYTCWADNSNFTGDNPNGALAPDGFDALTSVLMLDPDDN